MQHFEDERDTRRKIEKIKENRKKCNMLEKERTDQQRKTEEKKEKKREKRL